MKKVLAAAAGLMLVGTMASTAMAEFYFSGDARARFYYQDNYDFTKIGGSDRVDETNWKSRIRVNVKAETKGGAYAISRIRLGNGTWDGGASGTHSVDVDRAYIGVPFGPVTVEAGAQYRDITPFMYYGTDVDGIDVNYKTDKTTVVAFYDMYDEEDNTAVSDDLDMGGVVLVQEFEGGWGLTVAGAYGTTSNLDDNGFIGDAQLTGALGSVSLTAEIGYQEDGSGLDSTNSDDDGWGGYVSAAMPVGPANIMGMVGGTTDGFMWDQGDFGPFEMLGDVNIINTAINPSEVGETWFVVVNPTFQATEALTLGAVFAYVPTDMYNSGDDFDFMEISGRATYAVTDGAKLIGVVGYLDTDDYLDDDPFGVGVSLEVSF